MDIAPNGELLTVQVHPVDRRWLELFSTRSPWSTEVELIEPVLCLTRHNGHANRDVLINGETGRIMGWAE